MGVLFWSLFCALSSFAIILTRKRELGALLLLSFRCLVTVNVLWLFLTVPRVGLQCVIVVFPDRTHLLLVITYTVCTLEKANFSRNRSYETCAEHLQYSMIVDTFVPFGREPPVKSLYKYDRVNCI